MVREDREAMFAEVHAELLADAARMLGPTKREVAQRFANLVIARWKEIDVACNELLNFDIGAAMREMGLQELRDELDTRARNLGTIACKEIGVLASEALELGARGIRGAKQ